MTNKKSYTGLGYTCMFLLTALIFSLLICLFINNGMADAAGKEGYKIGKCDVPIHGECSFGIEKYIFNDT